MADKPWDLNPARTTRGFNINFHPYLSGWRIEITPNPLTVAEAMRPCWHAQFEVDGFGEGQEFTMAQCLSLLAIYVEDIAAERLDPVLLAP